MNGNTCAKRVLKFRDHFKKPDLIDIPGPSYPPHPLNIKVELNDWLQSKEFPNIFVIKDNDECFYCAHHNCKVWLKLNHTFGNIKSHIKSKHTITEYQIRDLEDQGINNAKDEVNNIQIPETIDKLISAKFKCMILKGGRPFSLINDPDIKSVLHFLGTRESLRDKCQEIASLIKSTIKYSLSGSSFISVAVDEWSDLMKKRYIGLTARCIFNGRPTTYFLALSKIDEVHLTGPDLMNKINNLLDQYDILDKIILAVSDNCNLMLNAFRSSTILRLPCICHLLNLLLKSFLGPSESTINEISTAVRCLRCSECYSALKDGFDEPRIANYNEIRWISLYECFDSLLKSRKSIETFYAEEEAYVNVVKSKLFEYHWKFIDKLINVLFTYKSTIQILETDDFGVISYALSSIYRLRISIKKLPDGDFIENKRSFDEEYERLMALFYDQIHPIYDAAAILNPYINKKMVKLKDGSNYIEMQMKKYGWSPKKTVKSKSRAINFLNGQSSSFSSSDSSDQEDDGSEEISPVQRLLNIGLIPLVYEKPDATDGKVLYRFWKNRLDSNQDPELAQVAIAILNCFCSSCSAERFFSTAGRVFTRNRMRLMPEVGESQVIIMSNKELADKHCKFE